MPSRPPVFRPHGSRTQAQHRAAHDAHRRTAQPWRRWYKTALWRERRAAQLLAEPLCERHRARGQVVMGNVANHKEPHRGDWNKFASGALETLCYTCHNSDVQREERVAAARAREG